MQTTNLVLNLTLYACNCRIDKFLQAANFCINLALHSVDFFFNRTFESIKMVIGQCLKMSVSCGFFIISVLNSLLKKLCIASLDFLNLLAQRITNILKGLTVAVNLGTKLLCGLLSNGQGFLKMLFKLICRRMKGICESSSFLVKFSLKRTSLVFEQLCKACYGLLQERVYISSPCLYLIINGFNVLVNDKVNGIRFLFKL